MKSACLQALASDRVWHSSCIPSIAEGRIREAASKVKWSYRHALAYLDNMEEALRYRVLERVRGGDQRGGTRLTAEGRRFVRRYTSLRHKAHTTLERLAATAFIDDR